MAANYRNSLITIIHIAKNNLGLDDEVYRELLFSVTGEVSSTKCSAKQLCAMLAELRRKGWRPSPKKSEVAELLVPLHKKIRAQCHALEVPISYAESIINRQTKGAATLKSATREQLTACISALTNRQKRVMEAGNG